MRSTLFALNTDGSPTSAQAVAGPTSTREGLAPGTIIGGDFKVIDRIGQGGMGVVYEVEQLSTRKRRALKMMLGAMLRDERQRQRFLQEAHVSSQIESDHIVDVVAAGIDAESGTPWLAMELLRGSTLEDRVRLHGPMPTSELAQLARQLKHVLGQAHALGLVHRDLKPENIFIAAPRGASATFTAKLLDFGIAKVAHESLPATASQVIGSPLWMAPEQWRPSSPVTPATDVWAIALVMFFAMTGQVYWRSGDSEDVSQIIVETISSKLEPPSTRVEMPHYPGDVRTAFDGWFLRCLERDPTARPADGGAALRDLVHALESPSPAPRRPPAAPPRAQARPPARAEEGIGPSGELLDLGPLLAAFDERRASGAAEGAAFVAQAIALLMPDGVPERVTSHLGQTALRAPTGALGERGWKAIEPAAGAGMQALVELLAPTLREALGTAPELLGKAGAPRAAAWAGPDLERRAVIGFVREAARAAQGLSLAGPPQVLVGDPASVPMRVQPTDPLSVLLSPSLASLPPEDATFLASLAAAFGHPRLQLRLLLSDASSLDLLVEGVARLLGERPGPAPRDLMTTLVRKQTGSSVRSRQQLLEALRGCPPGSAAAWWRACDEAAFRAALVLTGRLAPALRACSLPLLPGGTTPSEGLGASLSRWFVSDAFAETRAGLWCAP